jgi:NAD(P)-dependent dehydrogenase (short-subunit alcohol dehydrogenase family)
VAERVVREGASVVLAGRRPDVGERAVARLRAQGGNAVFERTDATAEADAARLVQSALTRFGRLDGAFNNAGGVNAASPVHDLDDSAWQADIAQNLTSV